MPQFNTTIDDISPFINYAPAAAWRPGTLASDPSALQYSNGGTFTLTQTYGATASFSFNGTAVWVFGAKRFNHGPYNVTLDSETMITLNGHASPDVFQTPLFASGTMKQGLHHVTIANAFTDNAANFIDIDYITWTSDIGTDTENISGTTVQDTDGSFSYQPALAWSTSPPSVGSYSGGSGHGTFTDQASVSYAFTGDAVSIFGTVGPQNGNYSVTIDQSPSVMYNATRTNLISQVLIYYADNLGPGKHNVTLTNKPSSANQGLNIDYAVVSTVPSVNDPSKSKSKGISGGAIGGIVTGVVVLLLLALILFRALRRRRQNAYYAGGEKTEILGGGTPTPYHVNNAGASSAGLNSSYPQSTYAQSGTVASYAQPDYGYQAMAPTVRTGAGYPVGGWGGVQSPLSPSEYSSSHPEDGPVAPAPMPNPHPAETSYPPSRRPLPQPLSLPGVASASQKGQPIRMGPAAREDLSGVPASELSAGRMHVEGRPQDFGHIPVDGEQPPPDYSQATEPYGGSSSRR
ncbi:hypothetical protein PLICRDRAFT_37120 [Plicaturopsis crispa FD-325 SS-3]|nr:hypothetical protein PLICRDRAFT_37120 [Plicaturopsis crispa FD-325 SS-3]